MCKLVIIMYDNWYASFIFNLKEQIVWTGIVDTPSKFVVFVGKTANLHTAYLVCFDGCSNASSQPARWVNVLGNIQPPAEYT